MISRNAYYLCRRLIRDYKVNPERGIKEWQWRMTQLNGYIMVLPSDALKKTRQSETRIHGARTERNSRHGITQQLSQEADGKQLEHLQTTIHVNRR